MCWSSTISQSGTSSHGFFELVSWFLHGKDRSLSLCSPQRYIFIDQTANDGSNSERSPDGCVKACILLMLFKSGTWISKGRILYLGDTLNDVLIAEQWFYFMMFTCGSWKHYFLLASVYRCCSSAHDCHFWSFTEHKGWRWFEWWPFYGVSYARQYCLSFAIIVRKVFLSFQVFR